MSAIEGRICPWGTRHQETEKGHKLFQVVREFLVDWSGENGGSQPIPILYSNMKIMKRVKCLVSRCEKSHV